MPYVVFKTLKFALWGLLLLTVGSKAPTSSHLDRIPEPGTYVINVSEQGESVLKGNIWYENTIEVRENGDAYSIVKLHLKANEIQVGGHELGFVVARQGAHSSMGGVSYEFSRHIPGLLQDFEGVFGFASVNRLGEQPFFARDGKIAIRYMGKHSLHGTLSLEMENAQGQKFKLHGNFNAVPKED